MSTGSVQTAQILQFPAGGRKAVRQRTARPAPANDLEVQAAAVAVGDAWYHAEAILDTRHPGDH